MYYIRFLKTPRPSRTGKNLEAKIAITTDLGESFLSEDVVVVAELQDESGERIMCNHALWRGSFGRRALDLSVPLREGVAKNLRMRMLVRPQRGCDDGDENGAASFEQIVGMREGEGGLKIVAVRSPCLSVGERRACGEKNLEMVERVFCSEANEEEVRVWEETGESIARHIWDAGLLLSAYLANLAVQASTTTSHTTFTQPQVPKLPVLYKKLTAPSASLSVLELGSGTGILSLTVAHFFHLSIKRLLLTDLPEATPILTRNLNALQCPLPTSKIEDIELDWAESLPKKVRRKWDLVCFADCCYNADVVPDLVKTLVALRETGRKAEEKMPGEGRGKEEEMLVLCATKRRHKSEEVFFYLMYDWGFEVVQKVVLPVGIGGEGVEEEVEIWLYK